MNYFNTKTLINTGKNEVFYSNLLSNSGIKNINARLEEICKNYEIKFINIESISQTPDYFFTKENYYFNYKGHRYISEKIIENI